MSDLCSEIEKFGKGISSTSRFRILQELFKGPRTVGELVIATRQSQPCVSQHLKTLKLSNLVVDERRGKEVRYTLNAKYVLGILKKLAGEVNKPEIKKRSQKNKKVIKK
jgi:DNA-binding transcriptional ArsR family regulator